MSAATAAKAKSEKSASPAEAAADVAQLPATVAPLLASNIWAREAGIKFNTWEVVPEAGTAPEALLVPAFWQHVSRRMRPGDTILVYPRDGAYSGQLVVWDAGQNWAQVSAVYVMPRPELPALAGVDTDFVVERDPIEGIMVKRRSTGAKVKSNFTNHAEAQGWIIQHQRALRTS